jgi:hypothetical protein
MCTLSIYTYNVIDILYIEKPKASQLSCIKYETALCSAATQRVRGRGRGCEIG